MKKESFRCSGGFSLIEAMVAIGILGVIGYFVVSLFSSSLKNTTQSNVSVQADTFKRNLINNLSNDGAWANTVLKNPSLSCLAPLYPTPPAQPGQATCANPTTTNNIIVQNAGPGGGTTVYDNSNPVNGFTSSGAPCHGYSAAGNDQCPFQMNLAVTMSCPAPATICANPQVELKGVLTYAPVSKAFQVALNASKYGFDFIRGQMPGGGVSGSGSANSLALWQGPTSPSSSLADSIVFQNGVSGIGIGSSQVSALSTLDVSGGVSVGAYAGVSAAPANGAIISGSVGIGTSTPAAALDVKGQIRPGSVAAASIGAACGPMGSTGYNASTGAPVYCSNSLKWTAVGGGADSGTICGTRQAFCATTIINYDVTLWNNNSSSIVSTWASCMGVQLTTSCDTSTGAGFPKPAQNCPAGYTGGFQYTSQDPGPGNIYGIIYCVKN
ncbi:MAG: type II secretion system protein [Bdellovibrionota bacterium]